MASQPFSYSAWPPSFTPAQLELLTLLATTYALSHSLLYLPPGASQPPAPTSAIHAPLSLVPYPLSRRLFDRARTLQRAYNTLYARVAMDNAFLDRVMGAEEGVGRVDDFTGKPWRGWKAIRDEGWEEPMQLGLFRSDYLLHADGPSLKQVEFNTISSSFGCLSERVADLHRYLHRATGYFGASQHLAADGFPANDTISGLAQGLAAAHTAYGASSAYILFVAQPNERNVFDQRLLEYALLETHGIRSVRQTFAELATSASSIPSSSSSSRILPTLKITPATPSPEDAPLEISVVYYRAAYTPTDYPSASGAEWATRFLLERTRAIKCPSIALQLAGGKKVQEALTLPGALEGFLHDFSAEERSAVRGSFMGMWGLDAPAAEGGGAGDGVARARGRAEKLVLKPQREGGGNNVYKEDIPPFLDALPTDERAAWIAMELIEPPATSGYLVRAGSGGDGGAPVRTEVVSELGIFGWALFGGSDEKGGVKKEVEEREVGWLVRTKGKESNEGGVAAGFSVLDSLVLIED
ncbi:hypothetical protein HWV62_12452 [Athelia sp. TMB]|nr:hypothetical protein HWV62_12452 [Athelia sp. TMB]